MESQPQNPEFRINPENFHPWIQDKNEEDAMQVPVCIRRELLSF